MSKLTHYTAQHLCMYSEGVLTLFKTVVVLKNGNDDIERSFAELDPHTPKTGVPALPPRRHDGDG